MWWNRGCLPRTRHCFLYLRAVVWTKNVACPRGPSYHRFWLPLCKPVLPGQTLQSPWGGGSVLGAARAGAGPLIWEMRGSNLGVRDDAGGGADPACESSRAPSSSCCSVLAPGACHSQSCTGRLGRGLHPVPECPVGPHSKAGGWGPVPGLCAAQPSGQLRVRVRGVRLPAGLWVPHDGDLPATREASQEPCPAA